MMRLQYRIVLILILNSWVCSAIPDVQAPFRSVRQRFRWPAAASSRTTTTTTTSHSSSRAVTTPPSDNKKTRDSDGGTYDPSGTDDHWDVRPWWRWDHDPYSDDWPFGYWFDHAPWPWASPPWHRIVRRYHGVGGKERWKDLDVAGKQRGRWTLTPKLDLIDGEGNTMVATFELPGLKKEDVHIEIDDQNKLIVTGESRLSEETDRDGYIFRERRVGRFKRVLDVPPGTEVDEIGAHLSDGVLTVTFPKTSRAELPRRKRITISS